MDNFVLINFDRHLLKAEGAELSFNRDLANLKSQTLPNLVIWETCRRIILLTDESGLAILEKLFSQIGQVHYFGLDAEAFLIEVLCGLRSPLKGETEVLGQFKNLLSQLKSMNHPWLVSMNARIQIWLAFIKKIRSQHLSHLGSQSYGSAIRRMIPAGAKVEFVGAGQLFQKTRPWLSDFKLRTWVRSQPQTTELSANFEFINLEIKDELLGEILIIGAPISDAELLQFMNAQNLAQLKLVIDLRHDSKKLLPQLEWITLQKVFESLNHEMKELDFKIHQAQKAIREWQELEYLRITHRPFGWEDLCS